MGVQESVIAAHRSPERRYDGSEIDQQAPLVPARVVSEDGRVLFTEEDVGLETGRSCTPRRRRA